MAGELAHEPAGRKKHPGLQSHASPARNRRLAIGAPLPGPPRKHQRATTPPPPPLPHCARRGAQTHECTTLLPVILPTSRLAPSYSLHMHMSHRHTSTSEQPRLTPVSSKLACPAKGRARSTRHQPRQCRNRRTYELCKKETVVTTLRTLRHPHPRQAPRRDPTDAGALHRRPLCPWLLTVCPSRFPKGAWNVHAPGAASVLPDSGVGLERGVLGGRTAVVLAVWQRLERLRTSTVAISDARR